MSWVIIQTTPGSEDNAERGLRQAGYRALVPRYRCFAYPHGRDRKSVPVLRPLFSRICFAQDWRGWPTVSIPSISGLMTLRPGIAAALSDADVARIMDRERERKFDTARDLEVGDPVGVEAFGAHILGVLDDLSTDGKAIVSAMLFGRSVRVSVATDRLHLVSR